MRLPLGLRYTVPRLIVAAKRNKLSDQVANPSRFAGDLPRVALDIPTATQVWVSEGLLLTDLIWGA